MEDLMSKISKRVIYFLKESLKLCILTQSVLYAVVPCNKTHVFLYQTLNYMSGIQHNEHLYVSRFLNFIILKSWAHSFHCHPEDYLSLI